MNPISAADNHSIQTSHARWRLLYNDKPLAEASPSGFRFGRRFGASRRLNEEGILEPGAILQVVLGWQQTDESWHLGLILAPDLAAERGSRWVELVAWPDPDIHIFEDLAQYTGQQLAQALDIPFYVIPPQVLEASSPIRDLPDLPIQLGDWQLERVANDKRRFVLKRGAAWTYRKLGRIAWYFLWVIIYLIVSIATLTSEIALPNAGTLVPNPHILPYLGIGIAVGLIGMMAYHAFLIFYTADQIMVDGVQGTVSAWKNRQMRWSVAAVEVQSVYLSEILKKRSRNLEYLELNLHLGGGKFQFLLQEKHSNHSDNRLNNAKPEEDIVMLNRGNYSENYQAVALYIAEALGNIPTWLDVRVK